MDGSSCEYTTSGARRVHNRSEATTEPLLTSATVRATNRLFTPPKLHKRMGGTKKTEVKKEEGQAFLVEQGKSHAFVNL